MKKKNISGRRRAPRADAVQRAQLLAVVDRSGLSAAELARQHGVHYTTFCGWRRRRGPAKGSPAFVQVELAPPAKPAALVLAVGAARLRLASEAQLPLAARLLQILQEDPPC